MFSEHLNKAKSIIPKSRNQKIITYVENELYEATKKASVDIRQGLRIKTEESANNGTLRSGTFINVSVTFVAQTITESCKNLLNRVEDLQTKWNDTFSDKTLDTVSELIIKGYQGLVDSAVRNDIRKIISITKPPSRSTDLQINLLRQNIPSIVDIKIKELKISNKVKKDDPGVREDKKANAIALLALFLSFVTLIVSLVSLHFSLG